ncbi:hypothetical protein SAMN05519103_00333 [Rhizobiales bacterium GAS113]|nr:hypothetical protein SAMN05519103_00333 [Rhizobiales bacterium GAS113]
MTEIFVSDHAVLRWLERVMNVDTEAARTRIRDAVRNGVKAGSSAVMVDGVAYVLDGNRVVTVTPKRRPAPYEIQRQTKEHAK